MTKNQSNPERFYQHVEDTLSKLDNLRKENLQQVRNLQAAKLRGREQEQKRLATKLGKDHPRVKQMAKRLRFQSERIGVLEAEIEKSQIQVPDVDLHTWMVHGRVLDLKGQGIKGLTIGLGDEKGHWIRALGYTCTDERGYFSIQYHLSKNDEEKVKTQLTQNVAAEQAYVSSFLQQSLYVLITDRYQKVLHRDPRTLLIQPNRMDYREIILKDQVACTPPPGGQAVSIIDPDVWKVCGRITDEQGRGIEGLTISLYDKDLIFDDKLGTCQTNDQGEFEIHYRTEKFRDLIEAQPDIYLKVLDKNDQVLHTTQKAVRFASGHVETYDIQIPADKLPLEPEDKAKDETSKSTKKTIMREIKIKKEKHDRAT